jgi:PPP family 3-phenylpropionic acid transporter
MAWPGAAALPRFLLLYAVLYAAFGVQSPYLPALLGERGLSPEAIGLALGLGTAVRLAAGPLAGRLADRLDAPRSILAICAALAIAAALLYLPVRGGAALVAVAVIQAAALAPLAPLTDSLTLGAAAPLRAGRTGFAYGWVRGAGSAAFIAGTIVSGHAVARMGLVAVPLLHAALLAATALAARVAPRLAAPQPSAAAEGAIGRRAVAELLRIAPFRRVVLVAALILGSHAFHDSFAVIRWRAAGIDPGTAGLLWSVSVAAEVVVFLVVGPPLLDRLGPGPAAALAALAGALRWTVAGATAALPATLLIQPLHGVTFALLHLACMRRLAEIVLPRLAATALALYGTVGIGAATALMTLGSGPLYAQFGARGFWAMAALCLVALPLARTLHDEHGGAAVSFAESRTEGQKTNAR